MLLEVRPAGASHPADCALCAIKEDTVTTFTQDQLDAAVAQAVEAATADLKTRLGQYEAGEQEAAIATAVEAATAESATQIADLTAKLEEAATARAAAEAEIARRDEEAATKAAQDALTARRDERTSAVKELKVFTDAEIDTFAEGWAALEDAAWEGKLAELTVLKDRVKGEPAAPPPPPTGPTGALTAAEDTGGSDEVSPARKVLNLRGAGVDATKII